MPFPSTLTVPPAPYFTAAGVTNGASFTTGISPGEIATIFGTHLSSAQGVVRATAVPLPRQLSGSSVTISGILAPLFAVANVDGHEQINLQAPFEIAGQTSVPIVINDNGITSQPVQVPVMDAQPGIFTSDGMNASALHGADYSAITPSSPAMKGETVIIFATGLGLVSPSPGTGNPASPSTLTPTNLTPAVTLGNAKAHVAFSGLAPAYVGLYQINAVVPAGVESGSLDLTVTVSGVTSKTVKIAVQ
jgi:uncharacterized protein (TIGR03437 family)